GVLLPCGADAKGNGNEDLKDKGNESQGKAIPDGILELGKNRNSPGPAVAKIAGEGTPQPGKIAHDDTFVHAVLGVEIGKPFCGTLAGAGTGGQLPRLSLHIAVGHGVDQRVDQEHDEE